MSHKHEEFINLLLEHINKKKDSYTFDELKTILEQAESKIPLCKNETEMRKTKCFKYVKPGYDYCSQHLNSSKIKSKPTIKIDDRPPVNIDMNVDKREVVKCNDVFVFKGTNIVCDERGNGIGDLEGHHVVSKLK